MRGLLIRTEDLQHEPRSYEGAWAGLYAHLPCRQPESPAQQTENIFSETDASARTDYAAALDAYAASREPQRPLPDRYRALEAAFACVERAQRTAWRPESAALSARIAGALNRRSELLLTLHSLLSYLRTNQSEHFLPLLPTDARFEAIPVNEFASVRDWLLCSTLETWERFRAWSSFWAGADEFSALSWLESFAPYQTDEMRRRRLLLAYAQGRTPQPPAASAHVDSAHARNHAIWMEFAQSYINTP